MEELVVLTCIAVAGAAYGLMLLVADLAGLCLGLGWRHFSKRRKALKSDV